MRKTYGPRLAGEGDAAAVYLRLGGAARQAAADGAPVYLCDERHVDVCADDGHGGIAVRCAACGRRLRQAADAADWTLGYAARPAGDPLCAACAPAYGGAVVLPERRRPGRRY